MEIDISAAVCMEFDDACTTMGLSYDELIEFAIVKLFIDKSNFVICPHCDSYLALRVEVENGEKVRQCNCSGAASNISYSEEA